jgi:anti-sigma factor RsiW
MDPDDQNLTGYLLGELREADQSALEERYFAEPEVFEQVVAAENKLLDDYSRGRLSEDRRARFERVYLTNPARRERVKFARALATRLDAGAMAVSPRSATASWWQNVLAGLRGLTPALRYSLAFATVLVLIFGAWFLLNAWRRQRESAQIQANAARQVRERAEQAEQERKHPPEVASGPNVNQPPPAPAPQPTVPPAPTPETGPRSVTLALTFGGVRGGGSGRTPALSLSPATSQVRLVLRLNDDDYSAYRASLQTAAGSEIVHQADLKPLTSASGATLVLTVSARLLPPGEYVLKISGLNPNGEVDDLSKSPFVIVRK